MPTNIPMLRAGGFRALAKLILVGALLACTADALAPLACAAAVGWTGAASRFWSNPNNWGTGQVPQNGDDLFFHSDTSNRSMINDLTDLRVQSLFFGAADYELSGNALTVTREIDTQPLDSKTYTINCPLHFSGRVVISVDGDPFGVFFESTTELNLNGPIVLDGTVIVSQNECDSGPGFDTRVHITGPISGTGDLFVTLNIFGSGTCGSGGDSYLEFKGPEPNTFRGSLVVGGGFNGPGGPTHTRVFLDKPDGVAVVNDRLVIERDGDVVFQSSEQIGDNAEVEVQSGGALQLRNFFETIGTLTLVDNNQLRDSRPPLVDTGLRVLTLNGGLTCRRNSTNFNDVPTIRGVLNLTGFLPFHIDGTPLTGLELEAQITGPGGFVKTGNGTLRLHGGNTFTDEVVVSDGVVEARHNLAFGTSAGGVSLAGGGLLLRDVAIGNEALLVADSSSSLVAFGTCTWSGSITLNRQLTIVGDDLHLPGAISGTGDLVLLGTAIELSGPSPNTFTGATVANCDLLTLNKSQTAFGGALLIGQDSFTPKEVRWLNHAQVGRVDTPVTLGPLALMNLNGHHDLIGSLTFRGGSVQNSGTATLGLLQTITARVATATATINGGRLAIALGQRNFHVEDGAPGPDLSITATIVDSGGITKSGPGTLLLNAPNSFQGAVAINEGVVHIQNNTSLGTTGAGTTVADGATLQIESVGALAEPLHSIQGAGHGGTLGVLNLMGATGIGVNVFMAGPSTVRVDDQFAILGGAISGTGPFTKVGAGTLQFGGGSGAPNTYTGDTLVQEGGLVLAKGTGVTTVPGHLIIGGGGGIFGTSAMVRHSGGFTIGGSVTLNRGGVWDLNGFSESFSVAELQGRPALTLNGGTDVQTGAGTLFLPVGDLVVNPGTFPGASSLISGHLALDPGPHRFIVQSGVSGIGIGGLELDVSAVMSQTAVAAEIVKEGFGMMRLGAANSFTGPVTVNEGGLTAAHASALGTAAGGTFVNGNAFLAMEGGFEIAETLTLDSTNAATLLSLGPVTNTWRGNIVLQRTAGIRVPDVSGAFTHFGGTTTFDISAISGPGGFTKSGPGALFITGLQGANSFTGPTTVTDGLLEALRRGSLSSDIVLTGANSTLRTARATGLFPARTVLPFGTSMTVQDGALWAMSGTNSETVSRLIGDGRLEIGTGGALTVTNHVSCEFTGPLSGSGALNKRGPATFQVTSPYSYNYAGAATVLDGTYMVDGDFRNSPVTVKAAAILRGSGGLSNVTVEAGGVVKVDKKWSGLAGGALGMSSVNFQPSGGVLSLDFFGPSPTGGNDYLYVNGPVTLGNPSLSAGFLYPPHEGDVVTLIEKVPSGAISGIISGFPEGSVQNIGNIPVVTSYVGGDGNEVTLTVTNLPLRAGGSELVSSSSGNILVPDDCGQLRLIVTNRSSTTVTNLRGTLRSLTDGVVVTIAESAFLNLAPNARGTNLTPFQIRTIPGFSCGAGAEFELVVTASNAPPIAIVYTFVGTPGYSLQFDGRDDQGEAPANTFSGVVNNFTTELWANPTADRTATRETNAGVSGVSVPLRQLQRFAVFPDRGDLAYGATHVSAGLSIGRNGISVFEHGTNRLLGAIHLPSRLVYSNAVSGWTHVALVYVSRQPRLYVNGGLVRSGVASIFSSVHPSGSLAGSIQGDFGNFEGQLDEVRIWSTALDQSQIQSNMTRRLTGTEPNLVTYFRCDEGGGILLADSAPASPNPSGTLMNGVAFVLADSAPITPTDADCLFRGGACESCFVVTGTFTTNTPTVTELLSAGGSPSLCFPTRACPGPFDIPNLPPMRYLQHSFTNTSSSDACVTAQLHFDCPAAPHEALHVAAYLGTFDPGSACANYLGDPGGNSTVAFSFRVPARTNVVLVVTLRVGDIGCDNYTLELFGLPCPPPALSIAKDSDKVLLQWSSAYPDFHLQAANSIDGSGFSNVLVPRALAGGKFGVTNPISEPREFFRLLKP